MTTQRILYVEDDDDVRETMAMLLRHEGYELVTVASAEQALEELGRGGYDLVLTDYLLPNRNAAWLIRSAEERGCLGDTPVIVLTGTDDPEGLDGYRRLRKPVSQEVLFAAFDAAMPPRPDRSVAPPAEGAPLRLRLYVSGTSQASRRARRNLALVLEGVDPARVEVRVHDIAASDPSGVAAAEEDRVVVIPTLVRSLPGPKVWVAGDLSDVAVVREAILPARLVDTEC